MIGGFQVGPFQTDYQQISGLIVPNLIGLDWYTASYLIQTAGFLQNAPPKELAVQHPPPGYVMWQDPVAGTTLTPNGVIKLTVSAAYLLSPTFGFIPWYLPPPDPRNH